MTTLTCIGLTALAVVALGWFTLARMGKALNIADPKVFDEVHESGGCAPPVYTSSADATESYV